MSAKNKIIKNYQNFYEETLKNRVWNYLKPKVVFAVTRFLNFNKAKIEGRNSLLAQYSSFHELRAYFETSDYKKVGKKAKK